MISVIMRLVQQDIFEVAIVVYPALAPECLGKKGFPDKLCRREFFQFIE